MLVQQTMKTWNEMIPHLHKRNQGYKNRSCARLLAETKIWPQKTQLRCQCWKKYEWLSRADTPIQNKMQLLFIQLLLHSINYACSHVARLSKYLKWVPIPKNWTTNSKCLDRAIVHYPFVCRELMDTLSPRVEHTVPLWRQLWQWDLRRWICRGADPIIRLISQSRHWPPL